MYESKENKWKWISLSIEFESQYQYPFEYANPYKYSVLVIEKTILKRLHYLLDLVLEYCIIVSIVSNKSSLTTE